MKESHIVQANPQVNFFRRTCPYHPSISTHIRLRPARIFHRQISTFPSLGPCLCIAIEKGLYEGKSYSTGEPSSQLFSENLPVPSLHLHTHPATTGENIS